MSGLCSRAAVMSPRTRCQRELAHGSVDEIIQIEKLAEKPHILAEGLQAPVVYPFFDKSYFKPFAA